MASGLNNLDAIVFKPLLNAIVFKETFTLWLSVICTVRNFVLSSVI